MNNGNKRYITDGRLTCRFMMSNTTFNNITAISWRSVLLVEETEYPEKTTYMYLWQVTDKLLYQVHLAMNGFKLTTLVVIGTDFTSSCKSNYHTITTMTAS